MSFAPDVSAATVYREFNFEISGSDNFRDFPFLPQFSCEHDFKIHQT